MSIKSLGEKESIFLDEMINSCNYCYEPLLVKNYSIADGCECNSRRGINHGKVPEEVCCCILCDPKQWGASRYKG